MLASADGEADNAGRAVSQMARRLGLSGGDLKQMFLAGAGQPIAERPDVAALRQEIRTLENALRQAVFDRDNARAELTNMKIGVYRVRAQRRGWVSLALVLVPVAVLAIIGVAMYGPDLSAPRVPEPHAGSVNGTGNAIVRSRATLLYKEPDRMSPVVTTLSAGSPLVVHKLVWNMMNQWAEVENGAVTGYVSVTDVELR